MPDPQIATPGGGQVADRLAEANQLLAAADTADFEDCEVCAQLEDFCVIHKAEQCGAAQMTELVAFVLAEPEGAWHWMQKAKRLRAMHAQARAKAAD